MNYLLKRVLNEPDLFLKYQNEFLKSLRDIEELFNEKLKIMFHFMIVNIKLMFG